MSKTVEELRKIAGTKKDKEFSRIVEVDDEQMFKVSTGRSDIELTTLYTEYHDLLPTGLYLTEKSAIELAAALVDAVRELNG